MRATGILLVLLAAGCVDTQPTASRDPNQHKLLPKRTEFAEDYSVEGGPLLRIEKRKVTGSWEKLTFPDQSASPRTLLIIDGQIVLRENDDNRDGTISRVRVRLSSGEYIELRNRNALGGFDTAERVLAPKNTK